MKKLFNVFIAVMMFAIGASAQHVEQSKLIDNVSITIKGGATTPLNDPVDHFRGIFGVELRKQITPVFGLGVEGEWTVDTSTWPNQIPSSRMIDHQYVGMFGATNIMNLFAGYKGEPRAFEVEAVLGVGWGHSYGEYVSDNVVLTKTGANINWNLGQEKEWTLSLKPAVVWNMNASQTQSNYNINRAALQLQVGVTYHFKNSNGTRSFVLCDRIAKQAEIDELNSEINYLRSQLRQDRENCDNQINALTKANAELAEALKMCEKKQAITVDKVIMPAIQFEFDSAELPETSEVLINTIANEILQDDDNYIVIGYASEEGSEEYNKNLSLDRANAVAEALIEAGVPTDRIVIEGAGETTDFSKDVPSLNRIVIVKN